MMNTLAPSPFQAAALNSRIRGNMATQQTAFQSPPQYFGQSLQKDTVQFAGIPKITGVEFSGKTSKPRVLSFFA